MSKHTVRSSFMSPVTGGAKEQKEFRCVTRFRAESKIAKLDKQLARALRRGDLDSVERLAIRRNNLFRSI